jgi:CRP-like cAMP-binding protein
MACRYKVSADGKRHILSFHIPGDIPDLQSLFIDVMDHSLATLVPTKIMAIPHDRMCSIVENHPRIARVLWRETLVDAGIFREWILVRGRPARMRVAHLLCEHFARMDGVGLTEGNSCALPITQAQIGDALGLSNVHVNRTLQELREEKLLELKDGTLTILDRDGLEAAGEFDAQYLHLKRGMGATDAG